MSVEASLPSQCPIHAKRAWYTNSTHSRKRIHQAKLKESITPNIVATIEYRAVEAAAPDCELEEEEEVLVADGVVEPEPEPVRLAVEVALPLAGAVVVVLVAASVYKAVLAVVVQLELGGMEGW